MKHILLATIIVFWCVSGLWAQTVPYTQQDRDRLLRVETKLESLDKRIDDLIHSIDKRFDMMQTQINNMMILIAALITGMIGFAGYLAHDRRKFQNDILAIQSETQIQKLMIQDVLKTMDETKAHAF